MDRLPSTMSGRAAIAADSHLVDPTDSIIRRFLEQVARVPDKIAVIADSGCVTYAELESLSGLVAANVLDACPDPGLPVALSLGNPVLQIATMLGVLRAGRFYVTIDPKYPSKRRDLMLGHGAAPLLIADRGSAAETVGPEILLIDEILKRSRPARGGGSFDADHPALLLFTSGSTGRPMAVVHSHGNVLSEVSVFAEILGVDEEDSWIQYASPSFAAALRSTYGALLSGGTLVLYDIASHGFSRLKQTIDRYGVTIWRSLPSTFRHFAATLDANARFDGIRVLSLGGETVSRTELERFNRHFPPNCVFMVSFGPSECLGACFGFMRHGDAVPPGRVSMGYERPGKHVWILGEDGGPAAAGSVGEIAVSGKNLAKGYWRDGETTARRFRVGPDGATTFLTGDLGVRNDDGSITHMGRRDQQVKVRGYRVDVVEIESVFRNVEGVRDAAVVAVAGQNGGYRLVGLVLGAPGDDELVARIRAELEKLLPDYMIPGRIVTLEAFPFNANGKLDRHALEAAARSPSKDASSESSESSDVLSILGEVLEVQIDDADKSFLELGGDSLQAAKASELLYQRLGVAVSMTRLLRAASLREIEEHARSLPTDSSAG